MKIIGDEILVVLFYNMVVIVVFGAHKLTSVFNHMVIL